MNMINSESSRLAPLFPSQNFIEFAGFFLGLTELEDLWMFACSGY